MSSAEGTAAEVAAPAEAAAFEEPRGASLYGRYGEKWLVGVKEVGQPNNNGNNNNNNDNNNDKGMDRRVGMVEGVNFIHSFIRPK
jgi:hypothetical protein